MPEAHLLGGGGGPTVLGGSYTNLLLSLHLRPRAFGRLFLFFCCGTSHSHVISWIPSSCSMWRTHSPAIPLLCSVFLLCLPLLETWPSVLDASPSLLPLSTFLLSSHCHVDSASGTHVSMRSETRRLLTYLLHLYDKHYALSRCLEGQQGLVGGGLPRDTAPVLPVTYYARLPPSSARSFPPHLPPLLLSIPHAHFPACVHGACLFCGRTITGCNIDGGTHGGYSG